MKASKTSLTNVCKACKSETSNITGLCVRCSDRMAELMDKDNDVVFGYPRIDLGTFGAKLRQGHGPERIMLMLNPDENVQPENWDCYKSGTKSQCIEYLKNVVLDAKLRVIQPVYVSKCAEIKLEETIKSREKWAANQIWLVEHECEHCGAPCGQGCYTVNYREWLKLPGRGFEDTQNYSWEEAGYDERPNNLGGVKTTYGSCMSCGSMY